MKLMTKKLEAALPAIYAQEKAGDDAVVHAHYFTNTGWHWFVTEYDADRKEFFGLVCGMETELGYFSLVDFFEANGKVERDLYWVPCSLRYVKEKMSSVRG